MPGKKYSRKPKYQNRTAFRHNPASKKTKQIADMPNQGLCIRCHDQIEWRKKYRKYKPLTVPRRCTYCGEKSVKRAYHTLCVSCARKRKVCAKCQESKAIVVKIKTQKEEEKEERELELAVRSMSERERRSFFRKAEMLSESTDEAEADSIEDQHDVPTCGTVKVVSILEAVENAGEAAEPMNE